MGRKENEQHKAIVYQIKIRGRLRENWADWLNGQSVKIDKPCDGSNDTTIHISVPDQAALRGVLNKIWDLNLTLIAIDSYKEEVNIGGTDEH